jgi:hypothetical protein
MTVIRGLGQGFPFPLRKDRNGTIPDIVRMQKLPALKGFFRGMPWE